MSLHKLTAGSGYDYLTRQVAALDATDKGRTGLASCYTERGESPGVWVGSGMEGIDGLDVGDPVTAEQMRALFGCGLHRLAELRLQQWEGPDFIGQDFRDLMRLGAPFKIMDWATPFRVEVAKRIAALDGVIGEPSLGTTEKPPEHRPHRRHRSVAGGQRHQSPRPATNRRNSTRNIPGPLETTPRPRYRTCHIPASRCQGRRATGSTHCT
jgi:hypothetical protein